MSSLADRVARALHDDDWHGQPKAWRFVSLIMEGESESLEGGHHAGVEFATKGWHRNQKMINQQQLVPGGFEALPRRFSGVVS
jgi:hypothetical protein